MQQPKFVWLGFAALGLVAIGCTSEGGTMDEVGDDTTGTTTTSETSSDSSSTDSTDTSSDATDTSAGDFQLIAAALADADTTLILTFSDAVGPVEGVDPSDFRISMALTTRYDDNRGTISDYSTYADPNVFFTYDPPVGMLAIAKGPKPDQISITLAPGLSVDVCPLLADLLEQAGADYLLEASLFPHYAPGDIPLTSEGGVELAAIGPDWVLDPGTVAHIEAFLWPNLDPQIPIPCM